MRRMYQPKLKFKSGMSLPMIFQEERAECGHACVAMIAHFWGHKLDLNGLRRLSQPSSRGITLRQIDHIFEGLGFKTRAIRVSLSELHLVKTPAVLHWNMNHFVVLKKVKHNKLIVHDPAVGVRVCDWDECHHAFTGIVLEVDKAERFQAISGRSRLRMGAILNTVTGLTRILGLLLLLSILIESMQLLNPLLVQYVTDHVVGSNYLNQLYTLGVGFCLFALLQGLVEYTRSHLVLYTTMHMTESFTSNVFNHLLSLPLSFFEARDMGDIQSKFQSIDHIKTKLSTDFVQTILDGIMIILTLSVMFLYSYALASMVIVAMSIYTLFIYISFREYKNQAVAAIALYAKSTSNFLETLRAIVPIKCFLKERLRFNSWRNHYIEALNHDISVTRLQIRYRILNQVLFHFEHILVMCVGADLVLDTRLTIGMLLAFLAYRQLLVSKFSSFIKQVFEYQLMTLQLDRLNDLLCQDPEVLPRGIGFIEQHKATICLKNLSFQYSSQDKMILDNISFEIGAGEKIAIIGPSGCGKSTLLKLLMGLEQPSAGDILVNDLPLRVFGLQNFREVSASVMQDDSLFTGSILENITFFSDEANMDKIYRVAQLVCIHDAILAMPMGYQSLIGHMGSTMSGGQKQRILLARALYQEPKILFLDEATSHLDVVAEQAINKALKTLQITQIMVAHRPETIKMADRIIDLSENSA